MSSAICFNLDQSKISSSGNGLTEAVLPVLPRSLETVIEDLDIHSFIHFVFNDNIRPLAHNTKRKHI